MRALSENVALPRLARPDPRADAKVRTRLRERGRALFAEADEPTCVNPRQAADFLLREAGLASDPALRHELETFFQALVDAAS